MSKEKQQSREQKKVQKIIWAITLLIIVWMGIYVLKDVYKLYNPDKNFNRTTESTPNLIESSVDAGIKNKSDNQNAPNENKSDIKTETKKAEQVVYKVNDTINANNLEFIVTLAQEEKQVGSQYFESKPSEGGIYVAVQWRYKNISDKPIGTLSRPRINLVDNDGTSYNSDAGATVYYSTELKLDRKIISDLNPDISVKDAQVFEISKEGYAKGGWNVVIKADSNEYKVNIN